MEQVKQDASGAMAPEAAEGKHLARIRRSTFHNSQSCLLLPVGLHPIA